MADFNEKDSASSSSVEQIEGQDAPQKVVWYRSTYFNAIILGITANALIFCLMVVSAFLSSALVNVVGIKITLILGVRLTNRFGNEWHFWMAEAAIALSYPEPERQGKFLGLWLTFKIGGQIVGGAINLGINAKNSEAGSVSYTVYLVFIALQCLAPFMGLFLTNPSKLQRTDGVKVNMSSVHSTWMELKLVFKLFMRPKFLLIVPLIANFVYTESVMFTYISLWFTVRSRALGSFISGLAAAIAGNLMGRLLDNDKWSHRIRARASFFITVTLQGALLAWNVGNSYFYIRSKPTFDWDDDGFGNGFAVFVLQVAYVVPAFASLPFPFLTCRVCSNFQVCYMTLFWICGELAETPEEVVRIAGLLRATESASQAYPVFANIGGAALNLGMWGVAIIPGWLIVSHIGTKYGKHVRERHEDPNDDRKLRVSEPSLHGNVGERT
ncbi:hypothetical protein BD626DRAFT_499150 [Schizophyllum amplum]|uniref:Major facilitator superfamily domain-containing protein n=1 Tax=Schizophyllum amplum TaxID=97359 RepID=A0A550CC76_9AGAR|nr:hypothetical protein BD626DRAFT_499150 [Auriculariopsis ampla]